MWVLNNLDGMVTFNFEFRIWKWVPFYQEEQQVVVARSREGLALPGGAVHGDAHHRPSTGGTRQDRAHVDAPPQHGFVHGDAAPGGAGAVRATQDLVRPQHEEDGEQDIRGQRRPAPRRRRRGGQRAWPLEVRGGGHRWGSWKRGGRGKRSLFF